MELARFIGSHRVVPLAALMLAGAILLPGDNSVSAAGPGVIERLGNGGEGGVAISADGRYVAFTIQGVGDVVLVDREKGSAQTISSNTSWAWGTIDISADGRYVAFATGEQLVPEDTCCTDIYVYDRLQDSYERVSVASDGSQADGDSDGWYDAISISADGRFVAFSSRAGNLAPGGIGLFVRDRLLGTTVRLSAFYAESVDMSADGRFVAVDGVSVYDRDTDEDGIYDEPDAVETLVLGPGFSPTISDDGRFVAYYAEDGITLRDRQTNAAVTVPQGRYPSASMELSGDGRYLAFATEQPLVPEDTNGLFDVYLYDRLTTASELLSMEKDGSPGNNGSAWGFVGENLAMVALTPDARYAAFHSWATNFVPGEGFGVFVAGTSVLGVVDTDGDGCSDEQELGPNEALGGRRDPESFWDFFDVPIGEPAERDRRVNVLDIGAVVTRFGSARETPPTKEEALAEALSPPPPAPAYHAASDRGAPIPGQELWNLLPPDGTINVIDIGAVVVQFGHTCA